MEKIRHFIDKVHFMIETVHEDVMSNLNFLMKTRILPVFRKRYYGIVWDWINEKYKVAYWIKDRNGKYIPWAHFDKHTIMCCSPYWKDNKYVVEMF